MPASAPDLNPVEGIWSLLRRSMASFATDDIEGLVRIIKRKLKKIQYRLHLINGCLAAADLTTEPPLRDLVGRIACLPHELRETLPKVEQTLRQIGLCDVTFLTCDRVQLGRIVDTAPG